MRLAVKVPRVSDRRATLQAAREVPTPFRRARDLGFRHTAHTAHRRQRPRGTTGGTPKALDSDHRAQHHHRPESAAARNREQGLCKEALRKLCAFDALSARWSTSRTYGGPRPTSPPPRPGHRAAATEEPRTGGHPRHQPHRHHPVVLTSTTAATPGAEAAPPPTNRAHRIRTPTRHPPARHDRGGARRPSGRHRVPLARAAWLAPSARSVNRWLVRGRSANVPPCRSSPRLRAASTISEASKGRGSG